MRHGVDFVEKERVPDRYREDDDERPCDHCDFQEIEARQAVAVMEAVKKERKRVLDELYNWLDEKVSPEEAMMRIITIEKKIESMRGES